MLYEEFKRRLVTDIREEFSDYTVEETTITKSGENTLDGVCVKINDIAAGPCMYVQHIFEDMIDNDCDYEEVITGVIDAYRHSIDKAPDIDTIRSTIIKWETARILLRARPILKASNEEFLRDKPYEEYLDFAIIYFLDLGDGCIITIPNGLVEIWEIDSNTLHGVAMTNMEYLRYTIRDIGNEFEGASMKNKYLCLSNNSVFGASSILSKNALKECATTLETDRIVIVPSSVHEVMVISREEADCKFLTRTLHAVNCTLEENEVLSDHLYFYDNTTGELTF